MFPQGTQSPRTRARCPFVTLKATTALHTQVLCCAEIGGSITFQITPNYLTQSYRCFVRAPFLKKKSSATNHSLICWDLQQIRFFFPKLITPSTERKKKCSEQTPWDYHSHARSYETWDAETMKNRKQNSRIFMEKHPFDVLPRPSAAALAQMNKAPVMRRNHMLRKESLQVNKHLF